MRATIKISVIILFLVLFGFLIAFCATSFILISNYMIDSTRNELASLDDIADEILNAEIE
jgi:hypothetical protein